MEGSGWTLFSPRKHFLFATSWSRRKRARAQRSGLTPAAVLRSFNHWLRSWLGGRCKGVMVDAGPASRDNEWGGAWFDVSLRGTSSATSTTCLELGPGVGSGVTYSRASSSLPAFISSSLETRSIKPSITGGLLLEELWEDLKARRLGSGTRKGSSMIRIVLGLDGGGWTFSWSEASCVIGRWRITAWLL